MTYRCGLQVLLGHLPLDRPSFAWLAQHRDADPVIALPHS